MKLKNNAKILLLTSTSLSSLTGGTIFVQTMRKHFNKENLFWAYCSGREKDIPVWMKDILRIGSYSISYNNKLLKKVRRRIAAANILLKYIYGMYARKCSNKIIEFIKVNNIDKLWTIADSIAIPICKNIHEDINIPYHLTIHDDIEGHNPKYESKMLMNDFSYLLKNYTTCDVTSPVMRRYYIDRYNCCHDAYIMWNGSIHGDIPYSPKISSNVKNIILTGNTRWTRDTILSFIKALEYISIRYKIKLRLYVFGQNPYIRSSCLKYLGCKDYQSIIEKIQKADLAYTPMSFKNSKKILCMTSLPGKLLANMQAQIPIIAHGPSYASNVNFVNENKIGIGITSNVPELIANSLIKYIDNKRLRLESSRKCRELIKKRFSEEYVWKKFSEILFRI